MRDFPAIEHKHKEAARARAPFVGSARVGSTGHRATINDTLTLCFRVVIGVGAIDRFVPLGLVCLTSKPFVVVALFKEKLLDVRLTVDLSFECCIRSQVDRLLARVASEAGLVVAVLNQANSTGRTAPADSTGRTAYAKCTQP